MRLLRCERYLTLKRVTSSKTGKCTNTQSLIRSAIVPGPVAQPMQNSTLHIHTTIYGKVTFSSFPLPREKHLSPVLYVPAHASFQRRFVSYIYRTDVH